MTHSENEARWNAMSGRGVRKPKRMEICQNTIPLKHTGGTVYVSKWFVRKVLKTINNIHIDHKLSCASTHFPPWSLHTTVGYVGI